ncbi:hypothetical protein [Dyadobacter fermentans]|nr:hypothetical protein [Dyadobacter fermentans]
MKTTSQNDSANGAKLAATYEDLEETQVRQVNEPEFHYTRLDPAAHGRVICEELTPEEEAMANDPNVKPFSHVGDSAAYVRRIRRDFRC